MQGEGLERLLVKGKKNKVEEVDGDPFRYFLLAGQVSILELLRNILHTLWPLNNIPR